MIGSERDRLLANNDEANNEIQSPSSQSLVDNCIPEVEREVKVYHRRWYILGLFWVFAFHQGLVWNTFSPLAETMFKVYGWDNRTIALISAWAPFVVIFFTHLLTWIMDVKGLRIAMLLGAGGTLLGTGVRCITSSDPAFTYLVHVGAMLNGFTEIMAMGAPALLSTLWFPANQRTTATSIAVIPSSIGVAFSFIVGPYAVTVPRGDTSDNSSDTQTYYAQTTEEPMVITTNYSDNSTDGPMSENEYIKYRIMLLLYTEFGVAAVIFLLILVYFPDKPPLPPSHTGLVQRLDHRTGMKQLFTNKKFLLLGGVYAVSNGVYWGWNSLFDLVVQPIGVSEVDAGWMGFYSVIVGNVAAIIIGIFADALSKQMKVLLVSLYSLSTIGYLLFSLLCINVIPPTLGGLYTTLIIGSLALNGGVPLFFELACESAYPVAEGVTNGTLVWMNNGVTLIFQSVLFIPKIGTSWMNWVLLVCTGGCVPIFFTFSHNYNRLDADEKVKSHESIYGQDGSKLTLAS